MYAFMIRVESDVENVKEEINGNDVLDVEKGNISVKFSWGEDTMRTLCRKK
jgi:hypothetical protein